MFLKGAIDECEEDLRRVGFNAFANDGQYNLLVKFFTWGEIYEFYWAGGLLAVNKAAYQWAVRYGKKRGVPVFLIDHSDGRLYE